MNRRLFLARLAAMLGAGALARGELAAASNRVELQRSPVAGFQYHQGAAVWPFLAVGADLELAREADNTHDARAVRVDWQGYKLGYVPRLDNAAVSHLLDNGRTVTATVVALRESANPWQRIEMALYLSA